MGYFRHTININQMKQTKVEPYTDKGLEKETRPKQSDTPPTAKRGEESRHNANGHQTSLRKTSKHHQTSHHKMKTFTITPITYTDIDYVRGILSDDEWSKQQMCRELFKHCKQYFDNNFPKYFFTGEDEKKDIFQNSFVKLWENIEQGKIYLEDNVLKDKGGKTHVGSLATYLMSIAKIKYLEWGREERKHNMLAETYGRKEISYLLDDDEEFIMLDIVSECMSHMSERCNQILSMYWYEDLELKDILKRIPTYHSINALKTEKYKCMKNLRKIANEMYITHTNS